jgi:hypothetical protein
MKNVEKVFGSKVYNSHYFIPVDEEAAFEKWVEATEGGDEFLGEGYDDNRIDGTFTFTDPRCE